MTNSRRYDNPDRYANGIPPDAGDLYGWRWSDMSWRERVGNDPSKILLEAVRRAVDIRDQLDKSEVQGRDVFLVDVLNELCVVLSVDTTDLWNWNPPGE